ncbi:hypothetical protein J3E69DRAFT_326615 [Trichoderma sp. SZMC 28015]
MSLVVEEQGQYIVPLWINGRALAAEGNVVHYTQCADANDAKVAVEAGAGAFPAWSTSSYIYRREILLEFANIVERRSDEIDVLQTIETSSMPSYGAMGSILPSRALREIASSISRVLKGEYLLARMINEFL